LVQFSATDDVSILTPHSDWLYILLTLLSNEYRRHFPSTKAVKHPWELPSLSHVGYFQRMVLSTQNFYALYLHVTCIIILYNL